MKEDAIGYKPYAEQVMKVGDNNLSVELKGYTKGVEKSPKGKDGKVKEGSEVSADTVNLSSMSKDIQKTRELLDSVPDIRQEKVLSIKRSIDDGTYSVNGDTIASNIVESALMDVLL